MDRGVEMPDAGLDATEQADDFEFAFSGLLATNAMAAAMHITPSLWSAPTESLSCAWGSESRLSYFSRLGSSAYCPLSTVSEP